MRFRIAFLVGFPLLVVSPANADWLDLKNGASLRGIDFKELSMQGKTKRCSFTLETGKVVVLDRDLVAAIRKSPPEETVELQGKQVSLREKVRFLREEDATRKRDALRDIEKWAHNGKDGEDSRKRIEALPAEDRERFLLAALTESKSTGARSLAARELATRKTKRSLVCLSWAAVGDEQVTVRDASLASLKTLADPGTADQLIPFLKSPSSEQRTRAASALEQFPSKNAVPVLIETSKLIGTDFGRGFFFQGEERAYINDYNLVSGGTGFAIVEVADPEVTSVKTGVVLDAKVRKVEIEIETRVRALKKITGQDFGRDLEKWRDWWKSSGQQ